MEDDAHWAVHSLFLNLDFRGL
uniref:Uncharacterized protein n=1 Tax=Anguilla anguilla TaxID=7936 RepID=A0A0E9PKI6_ANGAN